MDDVKAQLTNLLADINKYELILDDLRLEIKETADQVKQASLTHRHDSIFEYVKELRADVREIKADLRIKEEERKREERKREERKREERRRGASPVKSAQKRLGRRQRPLTPLLRPLQPLQRVYGFIRTPAVSMTSVGSVIPE
ncbi:hypothetical protein HDU80_001176 [Chytriomyces hyalinus]|nr:hypothetical protein HDU80_001176 [Chytriomyces hyalinus]